MATREIHARHILGFVLALALAAPLARAGNSAADSGKQSGEGPVAVVRQASQQILDVLDKNSGKLADNPELAQKLVKQYLLPHWDFDFTSQLVLGRTWRTATPKQREEFKQAFLHYLTATYAKGISGFHDAKVQVLPFRGDTSQQYVTVQTRVEAQGHEPVEVDYVMRKTDGGWKAFDVKIAGVSYVQTYRNEFQSEIRRTSLDALIKRLENTQAKSAASQAGGAGKAGR